MYFTSPQQKQELKSYIKQIRMPLLLSGLGGLPYNCLSALVPIIQAGVLIRYWAAAMTMLFMRSLF